MIRRLKIIGEAVKGLPAELRDKYPDTPWSDIAGARDIMTHEYFRVDLELAWQNGPGGHRSPRDRSSTHSRRAVPGRRRCGLTGGWSCRRARRSGTVLAAIRCAPPAPAGGARHAAIWRWRQRRLSLASATRRLVTQCRRARRSSTPVRQTASGAHPYRVELSTCASAPSSLLPSRCRCWSCSVSSSSTSAQTVALWHPHTRRATVGGSSGKLTIERQPTGLAAQCVSGSSAPGRATSFEPAPGFHVRAEQGRGLRSEQRMKLSARGGRVIR